MPEVEQRFMMKAAVYVILRRDNKILLSKRANTGYQDGNYGLPSGHMDGGELAVTAAAREAKEEVGIVINPADLRFVHATHRLSSGVSTERMELFFECYSWQGEPYNAEPEKCDDVSWFPMDELPDNMIPLVQRVLQAVSRGVPFSEYETEPVD